MSILDIHSSNEDDYLLLKRKNEVEKIKRTRFNDSWSILDLKNELYELEKKLALRRESQVELSQKFNNPLINPANDLTQARIEIKALINQKNVDCPFCGHELKYDLKNCLFCGWRQ